MIQEGNDYNKARYFRAQSSMYNTYKNPNNDFGCRYIHNFFMFSFFWKTFKIDRDYLQQDTDGEENR